jgi:hypothetical protein
MVTIPTVFAKRDLPRGCRPTTLGVSAMSPSDQDKLLSLLTEIHSDIRQIKSDLQSLLTPLKQQQQRPSPGQSSSSYDTPDAIESAQSGSPEDVLRYLRETRGEDDAVE